MSYVLTTPEMLAAAATDVGTIGSAIGTASSNAAGPTTGVLPAAEDEVSAAIAKLFGGYGQEYQAAVSQAAAFHDEFTQALAAAGNAYLEAEGDNSALMLGPSNALNTITSPIQTLLGQTAITGGSSGVSAMASMARAASANPLIALIMGGTGNPTPDPGDVTSIFNSCIQPKTLLAGAIPQGLCTPERSWPITGLTGALTQEDNALVLTHQLPLLQPIRDIPLVDLGYGSYGPGLNYGNIPTPAGLLELVNPFTTTPDLTIGAVRGPQTDPGLNFFLGQPSTTGLSVLSGATGDVLQLIPPVH